MTNQDLSKSEVVTTLKVSCSGELTTPSEGHPLVWLQIPEDVGHVFCPYCEKKFIYEEQVNNG